MNMFLKLTQLDRSQIIINVDDIVYIEERIITETRRESCICVQKHDSYFTVMVKDNIEDIYELLKSGNRMIIEENGKMTLV